jgi:hypothetical protein
MRCVPEIVGVVKVSVQESHSAGNWMRASYGRKGPWLGLTAASNECMSSKQDYCCSKPPFENRMCVQCILCRLPITIIKGPAASPPSLFNVPHKLQNGPLDTNQLSHQNSRCPLSYFEGSCHGIMLCLSVTFTK